MEWLDFKELSFGILQSLTKTKPKLRKLIDNAFMPNLCAAILTAPIIYGLYRYKPVKVLNNILFLFMVSYVNDLFIEKKRVNLISENYEPE